MKSSEVPLSNNQPFVSRPGLGKLKDLAFVGLSA